MVQRGARHGWCSAPPEFLALTHELGVRLLVIHTTTAHTTHRAAFLALLCVALAHGLCSQPARVLHARAEEHHLLLGMLKQFHLLASERLDALQ